MSATSTKSPFKRILSILFGSAFLASTSLGIVTMFQEGMRQPEQTAVSQAAVSQDLEAQAQGYESILEREPENSVALQGLVETRLQMNDLAGAIAPMEKLVESNPDREDYKALLAQIKLQATPQKPSESK